MAYLDPNEAFEHFKERALAAIGKQFPIDGRVQSLELERLEVQDNRHPDDIREQQKAKVNGETWGVPVVAHLVLRNKETGKEVRAKTRIAELPKITNRYSQIVNGQEYQVDNQWQLKPGAYVRRRNTGQIETRFQSAQKPSFDVTFDDVSKEFRMEYGKAKLPLYPIMKAMGVGDQELEKAWGKEILAANKQAKKSAGTVEQFYRTTRRSEPPDQQAAVKHLLETMRQTNLRPDATEVSLGKPFSHVDGAALAAATQKMLRVQAGAPPDDRDNLVFKDLRSAGDYAYEKIMASSYAIKQKALRKINTATSPRDVVRFDVFNKPILSTFHDNAAAQVAKQVNPIEMVASSQQTTVLGPGGIQSEQSIVDETKFVNPSHMGYLDPINTPEGGKTGVTLRMPVGVKKINNEPHIPLYNVKSGKMEYVGPRQFLKSKVALPDQITWKDGKPVPRAAKVKISDTGNDVHTASFKDVDYVMRHPSQFFNVTSNLIPFLNNTSGGRAGMAARHMEQAISLVNREAPLVQVGTGVDRPGASTFEEVVGTQASHRAPVSGTVKAVKDDAIIIEGADGKPREVQLYRNYPLNDSKSVLDSTPLVKPGDRVKAGQPVADTNFSRNGAIALGTNLRVAYIPYKGYNFEDGIVISESAANKLSSVHMHKHNVPVDPDTVTAKKKYIVQHAGSFKRDQLDKISDDGLVKPGTRVLPGDPLVLAMKKSTVQGRVGLSAIRKSLGDQYVDRSLTWEGETAGEVVGAFRKGDEVVVHVKTIEPMQVGDKLAGRYGNKGIVTAIVKDEEMPRTQEGRIVEVALNPSGVPGRMNLGQVLETAASKIAEKTGKPYVVENFGGVNQLETVKKELKKHGIKDTEVLFDPTSGQTLGAALVGNQHMIKLHHQVDKKVSVRSGMNLPGAAVTEKYDINLQPSGGGHASGQAMDPLGFYSLLAHGARANVREMTTWKSEGPDPSTNPQKQWQSQHHDVWDAIQHGDPLPAPKTTFAFKKFTDMLQGAGINIEKKGNELVLSPLTDRHIEEMAGDRVLTKPAELLYAKIDPKTGDPKPKPGGLFDEKLTGGHGGRKWSRIALAEPVPNPVFETSIRAITGLSEKDYRSLVQGERAVDQNGNIVDLGKGTTGGAAIEQILGRVDVATELQAAKKELNAAPASKVDKILKKVKRLQALQDANLKPAEAYVLHSLPVLPPALRPVTVMQDGNFNFSDINRLYSQFAQNNEQLKDPTLSQHLTDQDKAEIRRELYDGVKAIMGAGIPYKDAEHKGLLHQIQGPKPKSGYFQSVLLSRKQDLSMRSTIVPEPSLSLDEVGLPREHAMTLFAPFVVGQLKKSGVAQNVTEAQKMVASSTPAAVRALQKVLEERPVLLKRDPALHKYSVQAFKPRLAEGNAIKIHPLVTSGYNADFDGDTMSVFVPISEDAVSEARKMFPSNNLFSEASGKVMYQPTLEAALGLYKLTRVNEDKKAKEFKHPADAVKAVQTGSLGINDPVKLGAQTTTTGRVLLAAALPESLQKSVLEDFNLKLDKKGLDGLLTRVAKDHTAQYSAVADKLKDLGNGAASGVVTVEHNQFVGANRLDPKQRVHVPVGVHSFSLDDFDPDTSTRDHILSSARRRVAGLGKLPEAERSRRAVEIWSEADQAIKAEHLKKKAKTPNNLLTMQLAGVKPNWDQYKQLTLAPMLVADASGRVIPEPITHAYSEGLDTGEYWNQMHGARRGSVLKVQQVRDPGYLSKLLMASTMDMLVTGNDCGTSRGIALPVVDKEVNDRVLQKDFTAGGMRVAAGTVLDPSLLSKMRAADKNAHVVVRSPLKCEHAKGVCQKCMGLAASGREHDVGENVGVMSAQTLGERAVQLTMREFHTGGAVGTGGGSKVIGGFDRFEQLMWLPRKIADSATMATKSGFIDKVENDPTGVKVWIGGKAHHVGKDRDGSPLWKSSTKVKGWSPPKQGMKVERGQVLSDPTRTFVNPHELYKATGSIESVQNFLTDEVYGLYKDEGVKRKHVETVVKAMSNLTKVEDPGDYEGALRGEFQPTSKVQAISKELVRNGKRPIAHKPVLKGVNVLPLSLQEDWLAKLQHERLTGTLLEAAAVGAKSNIHGTHPVPGIAYGAEFGLNQESAKGSPKLTHLLTVPKANY